MDVDEQMADTHYAGPDRRRAANCDAGERALRYLNGDGPKQPGVFSRLDRIERLMGVGMLVIAGPLWWMAWMMYRQNGGG